MTDRKTLAERLRSTSRSRVKAITPPGEPQRWGITALAERLDDLERAADALTKPLDDPHLQELFMSAITGAMAQGRQGINPPPAGHWLQAAWDIGRAEGALAEDAREELEVCCQLKREYQAQLGAALLVDNEGRRQASAATPG